MFTFLPKDIRNSAIGLYLIGLLVVSLLYYKNALPFQYMLFGLVAVIGFFYFTNKDTIKWHSLTEKRFIRKIFWTAFILRVIYVIFSYFYNEDTGIYLGLEGDAYGYYVGGHDISNNMLKGNWGIFKIYLESSLGISDSGYIFYLGVVNYICKLLFIEDPIIIVRLLKALYSSITCILVYKLATRNFGDDIGRIAAVFCVFMPHFIFYCGLHLKETEMVFITIYFVERTDYLLRSKKYNFINLALPILLAGCLFAFRTVLGATALLAFFTSIVFSSGKVVGWGRRVLIGVWLVVAAGYFFGNRIYMEAEQVWDLASLENQQKNMEWRAVRKSGGNTFAKYAGATVFAPMIFTIPFPTIVNIPGQRHQMMMNGSNFVKNITAFFTILGICLLFYRKQWRHHILILSFLIGYLGVIAFSNFAQSERFHMPSLPFALIIAAYGLSQMDIQKKKYYNIYIVIIFIAMIGWSWFKLAGKGIIDY